MMYNKTLSKTADVRVLQERIAELERKLKDYSQLKRTQDALKISQRRYEIAMGFSDVTVFDYNIKTKKILTQPVDFELFGMPGVLENGVEDALNSGIIADKSKDDLRALYRKIDDGAPSATTRIYAKDLSGNERILELQMVTIFDQNHQPTYAIGVRKDITDSVRFHKEKKYSDLLASELTFIYEANVTQNRLIRFDSKWAEEIGLGDTSSISGILQLMATRHVAPEDVQLFIAKQAPPAILEAFQKGERVVVFEYRKRIGQKDYQWFEVRINIIQDELTKDINMRVYILNIDLKKKNALKMLAERKRYETALAKSITVYEVNITQNTINLGQKELFEKFNVSVTENHAENALPFILKNVHPLDKTNIASLLTRAYLIEAYAAGNITQSCDYRIRHHNTDTYLWFRCTLQLFEESQSHDLLCYAYIENIHEEKEKELALLYKAQHDLMTGFYNKSTTEEKIDEILSSDAGKLSTHIFFIIDLDHFKLVNDKFGHAFGDAVLSQAAAKISTLFRNGDILGRIGGDEFIVFMKDVQDNKIAFIKARELCEAASDIYVQNGTEYRVTVSVGIAFYDKHGTSYAELYRHSDTALYSAKEQGRNRFALYHESMQHSQSAVNDIDQHQIIKTKTFENNVSEYVFRILYESHDKEVAINAVLELMGKHYHVSRVYIFENSADDLYACNTFEWCNQGIAPQIACNSKIPYSILGNYPSNFNDDGVFYLANPDVAPMSLQNALNTKNIKSMIQFSIQINGHFSGFVGFDECTCFRAPCNQELTDYRSFANILGVFITEMRAFEKIKTSQKAALSIVNGLDSYAYVCDPATYQLLFINDTTSSALPDAKIGDQCYRVFWHHDAPCTQCPLTTLVDGNAQKCDTVLYNPLLKIWVKMTASWIDWLNNERCCLINSVDITAIKQSN